MASLKELQDKRLKLANTIEEHRQKFEAANDQNPWTAEQQANWETLNADYDKFVAEELKPAQDAKKAEDDQRAAMTARMAEINGYQDYQPAQRQPGARARFGRDGASLANGPRNRGMFSSAEDRRQLQSIQATALRGWMLADEHPEDVTEEQHQAMQICGMRAGASAVELSLRETPYWHNAQRPYRLGSRTRGGAIEDAARSVRNDVLEGSLSKGGALVGETLLTSLEEALLSYAGPLQYAEIMVTDNGEMLRWPTIDDTANTGTRVGEGQDATNSLTSTDPKTGRLNLQAFTFTSGGVNISRSFIQDTSIDLVGMLGRMLGVRIARKQTVDFTTGADVGNGPIGIVTAASAGNTAASATGIIYDDTIDLIHKVDPAYREQDGVGYSFHDSILQVLRKIKDGVSRPIWSAGTSEMEPDRLNGYRYWINQSMASVITSGAKTMLFGKLDQYKVRLVNGLRIQRLIERRAEFDEDVFIAYLRGDGGLLDPAQRAVKYMTH